MPNKEKSGWPRRSLNYTLHSYKDFRALIRPFVRLGPDFHAFFHVYRLCNFERTSTQSCVHLSLYMSTFRMRPQPGLGMQPKTIYAISYLIKIFAYHWEFIPRTGLNPVPIFPWILPPHQSSSPVNCHLCAFIIQT